MSYPTNEFGIKLLILIDITLSHLKVHYPLRWNANTAHLLPIPSSNVPKPEWPNAVPPVAAACPPWRIVIAVRGPLIRDSGAWVHFVGFFFQLPLRQNSSCGCPIVRLGGTDRSLWLSQWIPSRPGTPVLPQKRNPPFVYKPFTSLIAADCRWVAANSWAANSWRHSRRLGPLTSAL